MQWTHVTLVLAVLLLNGQTQARPGATTNDDASRTTSEQSDGQLTPTMTMTTTTTAAGRGGGAGGATQMATTEATAAVAAAAIAEMVQTSTTNRYAYNNSRHSAGAVVDFENVTNSLLFNDFLRVGLGDLFKHKNDSIASMAAVKLPNVTDLVDLAELASASTATIGRRSSEEYTQYKPIGVYQQGDNVVTIGDWKRRPVINTWPHSTQAENFGGYSTSTGRPPMPDPSDPDPVFVSISDNSWSDEDAMLEQASFYPSFSSPQPPPTARPPLPPLTPLTPSPSPLPPLLPPPSTLQPPLLPAERCPNVEVSFSTISSTSDHLANGKDGCGNVDLSINSLVNTWSATKIITTPATLQFQQLSEQPDELPANGNGGDLPDPPTPSYETPSTLGTVSPPDAAPRPAQPGVSAGGNGIMNEITSNMGTMVHMIMTAMGYLAIVSPLTFGIWSIMLSPVFVLAIGGVALSAMHAQPLISSAFKGGHHAPEKTTIIVHKPLPSRLKPMHSGHGHQATMRWPVESVATKMPHHIQEPPKDWHSEGPPPGEIWYNRRHVTTAAADDIDYLTKNVLRQIASSKRKYRTTKRKQ